MCWLAQGKVFSLALGEFGFMLYRFESGDKRNDGFDLFGAVIELATYLVGCSKIESKSGIKNGVI